MRSTELQSCQGLAAVSARSAYWRNITGSLLESAKRANITVSLPESLPPPVSARHDCASLLRNMDATARYWRSAAGKLHCSRHGIGPRGGFCVAGGRDVGGNSVLAPALASSLAEVFHNHTVLDLGCGVGQYGRYFLEHDPTIGWVGVDGGEGIEEATLGRVRFAELSEALPLDLHRRWDWVMSLEVGEHLPRSYEAAYLHSVAAHVERGVVISWAAPGTEGHHHRNCQPNSYVECAMALVGLVPDVELQDRLRSTTRRGETAWSFPWLRNIMAFRKRTSNPPITQPGTEHGTERGTERGAERARFGALLPLMRSSPTAEFIALYERLTLGCGYVYDGCRGENNASAGLTKAQRTRLQIRSGRCTDEWPNATCTHAFHAGKCAGRKLWQQRCARTCLLCKPERHRQVPSGARQGNRNTKM